MNCIDVKVDLAKKNIIRVFVISFLVAVAMGLRIDFVSLQAMEAFVKDCSFYFITTPIDSSIGVNRLIIDLFMSIQYDSGVFVFLFVGTFFYFIIARQYVLKNKQKIVLCMVALLYSLLIIVSSRGNVDIFIKMLDSGRCFIKIVLCLIGYSVLLYQVLCDCVYSFEIRTEKTNDKIVLSNKEEKKYILKLCVLFLVLWTPYIVTHFPCVLIDDCAIQIREMNKLPIQYDAFIIEGTNPKYYYTTGNTLTSTLILQVFFTIGKLLGSQNVGLFLYVIFQSVFMAYTMAYTVLFSKKRGINQILLTTLIVFVGVFPLFPSFAVYLLPKNTLFSMVFIWFILLLYHVLYESESKISRAVIVKFVLFSLLLILLDKKGLFVVAFAGMAFIMYAFFFKKKMAKYILLFIVPLMASSLINSVSNAVFDLIVIKPVEMYSIPFQQTGRFVTLYDDEITTEEKRIIDKVFYYDKIKECYGSRNSDGMKDRAYRHDTATKDDLMVYLSKVWIKQFFKHPLCYVAATFNNQSDLLNVCYPMRILYGYDFSESVVYREFNYTGPAYGGKSYVYAAENIDVYMPEQMRKWAHITESIEVLITNLPVVNLFSNMGIYFYFYLFMFFIAVMYKRYKYLVMMSPVIIYYMILIASPYAGFRYLSTLMFSVPIFVFGYVIGKKTDDKKV